jgi:predicted metal-dependent phosphotriesterase family hydrolase
MAKICLILGDIDSKELGFTLAYEHLITRPPNSILMSNPDMFLDDLEPP